MRTDEVLLSAEILSSTKKPLQFYDPTPLNYFN